MLTCTIKTRPGGGAAAPPTLALEVPATCQVSTGLSSTASAAGPRRRGAAAAGRIALTRAGGGPGTNASITLSFRSSSIRLTFFTGGRRASIVPVSSSPGLVQASGISVAGYACPRPFLPYKRNEIAGPFARVILLREADRAD